ncbi:MAG: HD domain-containing protein [Clostridia bacterium]|nr:HD domain-containing protein [Clostridia bacterium]
MIDENKLKHIIGVARLMKEKAYVLGLDETKMFTLGMVHDIGFEFGTSEEHHEIGYLILKNQGYEYALEVLYHGKPTDEYVSDALDLLNFADMHIDKKGNYVAFEERLEDIKARRGVDSPHYQNCKRVIENLISRHPELCENESQK